MVKRGWFNESFRHTMSAYGIKTNKQRPRGISRSKPRPKKLKVDWQMRYRAEKIAGGLAEGLPNYKYDPDQLYRGLMVEFEHTNDREIAEEIAKDHLTEDPNYYEKLAKMESGSGMFGVSNYFAEKESSFFAPDPVARSSNMSAFEEITGLRPPKVPAIPHEARLLKPEMRKRMAEEQEEVAEMSDKAFHALEEGEERMAERAMDDVEAVHEAQELTQRGREQRFIGGRPLTKAQMEEDME